MPGQGSANSKASSDIEGSGHGETQRLSILWEFALLAMCMVSTEAIKDPEQLTSTPVELPFSSGHAVHSYSFRVLPSTLYSGTSRY